MKKSKFIIVIFFLLSLFLASSIAFATGYYNGYKIVKIIIDGEEVKSDVPAMIIDGRTMVPLRFVSESFGAEISWNSKTNTATITSKNAITEKDIETTVRPKLISRKNYSVKDIKNILEFDYSEKVFTIYAFANYTGFKENNSMPFHPVREAILKDIKAINPTLTQPTFMTDMGWSVDYLDYMGMVMEGPPYFKPIYLDKLEQKYKDGYGLLSYIDTYNIDELLAEFYVEANIHELYLKYKPEYEKEINRVSSGAYGSLVYIFNDLNLDLIDKKIIVDMSKTFLMASGRAEIFSDFPDISRGNAVVMSYGLNKDNLTNGSTFAHEVLHLYVNPILDKNKEKVLNFILKNDIESSSSYDMFSMVDELFIRVLQDSKSQEFINYDRVQFPMAQDILNYYHDHYNPETDNLEYFLLDALIYFSK